MMKITRLSPEILSNLRFKQFESSVNMTKLILIGSFIVTLLLIFLLLISWILLGNDHVQTRVAICFGILAYLCFIALLFYKKYIRIGAWMLLTLYSIVGFLILYTWGINAPIGILILGFVIFLASVILGPQFIPLVTILIIIYLGTLQLLVSNGFNQPDTTLLEGSSSFGDVAGYATIFTIFALIAWVSGMRTQTNLKRAHAAEMELQVERDTLVKRVEEQTNRILEAQQKELKQLYKFAELGQLTTIILHELANYLSILTLDIDDLKERHQNSTAIKHAKESIFYIDTIIEQVRSQLSQSENSQKFDTLVVIKNTIQQLQLKLRSSNLKLFTEDSNIKTFPIFGDPLRLSQAITILVTNAAQASNSKQSEIILEISSSKSKVLISVKDFGTGISVTQRKNLFQPQKSEKGSGLGIGLYVTKQIIETHFKGKIWLSPATEYTQFNIQISRSRK